MSKEQVVLVQGPPGTGKTSAILGMIAVLLQKELSQQQIKHQESKEPLQHAHQPERRVLVCAQSNAAVDEIAERLAVSGVASYAGKTRPAGIVRCGKLDAMNEKITVHHIDNIAEQREKSNRAFTDQVCKNKKLKDELEKLRGQLSDVRNKIDIAEQIEGDGGAQQKELSGWRDQRRRLQLQLQKLRAELDQAGKHAETVQKETKQHVLRSAEVVLCTLSGSGGDLQQLMTPTMPKFDALIVDEAAQALEPSMLIPLRQLSTQGIVVLVGDPRQLPPTVKSRNAQYANLSQSMFERFQKCQHQVVMLSEQYRMHPEISRFPSFYFYDNMLLDGMGISSQSKSAHYHQRLGPLMFIDHRIGREQSGKTGSLRNQSEAQLALNLVQGLVDFCGADLYTHVGSIAIISPYKAQINLLKQLFERKLKKEVQEIIDVSTVDAYQGKEADVVIFSCVRAQVSSVGFLSDVRRMNVAFTRAKRSLWVIGHSETLQSNEAWSAFIQDAKTRNLVIQADQLATQLKIKST